MKARVLLLVSVLFLLSACVTALPASVPETPAADTPAPAQETAVFAEPLATETATDPPPAPDQNAEPALAAELEPTATALPKPTPTPGPQPPAPEAARDLVLDYLRQGYQYKLPENESFAAADIGVEVDGVTAIAGYASGPFQVVIGQARMAGERLLTPVNMRNIESNANWWGDVDENGLVTTLVAVKLPSPRSKRVTDWVGVVTKLPPGSPFDDYFLGGAGNRHGIASNKAEVNAVLDRLGEYEGRVKVSGELRYAVEDYNARRLLINRIELLDGSLPEADAAAAPDPNQSPDAEPEPTPFFGPTGALINPAPGSVLVDRVSAVGEAEGIFENSVIVQVEDANGAVLGRAFAITDAADIGQRGSFSTEVEFSNPGERGKGRVGLYSENAGDGSLNLLAWVNVTLAAASAERPANILLPEAGASIKEMVIVGGTVKGISGDIVQVRVEDLDGGEWGQAQAQVNADGLWEVHVKFDSPPSARPGRIALYEVDSGGNAFLLAIQPVDLLK